MKVSDSDFEALKHLFVLESSHVLLDVYRGFGIIYDRCTYRFAITPPLHSRTRQRDFAVGTGDYPWVAKLSAAYRQAEAAARAEKAQAPTRLLVLYNEDRESVDEVQGWQVGYASNKLGAIVVETLSGVSVAASSYYFRCYAYHGTVAQAQAVVKKINDAASQLRIAGKPLKADLRIRSVEHLLAQVAQRRVAHTRKPKQKP